MALKKHASIVLVFSRTYWISSFWIYTLNRGRFIFYCRWYWIIKLFLANVVHKGHSSFLLYSFHEAALTVNLSLVFLPQSIALISLKHPQPIRLLNLNPFKHPFLSNHLKFFASSCDPLIWSKPLSFCGLSLLDHRMAWY